jgi:hypothetical protein
MGIALSSSISAERTIAGGIVAARSESRQVTFRRFRSARRQRADDTFRRQPASSIRYRGASINLCVFLSTTTPAAMRQPRGHHAAPARMRERRSARTAMTDRARLPRGTRESQRVAARATTAWHKLHERSRHMHDNNHSKRACVLP